MIATLPRSRRPLGLAIALALSAGGADAATITVTAGGDSGTPATCTLRQAISAVTSQTTSGTGCNASAAAFGTSDTIVFDQALAAATITLALGQLSVVGLASPLTIQGSGQTIDANQQSRVLYVRYATLSASNLTLTGGANPDHFNGAGVWAYHGTVNLTNCTVSGNSAQTGAGVSALYGDVTLTNCTISGNTAAVGAGGVYSWVSTMTLTNTTVSDNVGPAGNVRAGTGTVALSNCTVSGNEGGGVYAYLGTISLDNTTVSGNSAVNGGGVQARSGTVTLTNSTVSGNSATGNAGGVYIRTNYAGASSSVTLTNSTVAGNSATGNGGGAYAKGNSTVTLTHSTVFGNSAGNGGGIVVNGSLATLTNSILSGNTAIGPKQNLDYSILKAVTASYSLLGADLNGGSLNDSNYHNMFSESAGLGVLANNGGPTQTMLPGAGSAAINMTPCTNASATDQRGMIRPDPASAVLALRCDAGAVEANSIPNEIFAAGFEAVP